MKTIQIQWPSKHQQCLISIENGLFTKIPELLKKHPYGDQYVIIADRTVAKLYGKKLLKLLQKNGIKAHLITFPVGEKSKNLQTIETIANQLLQKNFTRHDAILALGGGVTGDIAGFTASTFLRGINFVQIPTTLLAMIDSSIGGKTGVNLTKGKNLLGTFYQPQKIWIDPNLLKTLPNDEFLNGFAEIIKYGIIGKNAILDTLEKSIKKNESLDDATLNTLIEQSVKFKASIIEKDEKEKNTRKILNYGHTIGHAIERLSDYKISHGKAVALGIFAINKKALELRLLEKKSEERIKKLLDAFQLLRIPPLLGKKIWSPEKLWSIIQNDKKMRKSKINFIMIKKTGYPIIFNKINRSKFIKYFPKEIK